MCVCSHRRSVHHPIGSLLAFKYHTVCFPPLLRGPENKNTTGNTHPNLKLTTEFPRWPVLLLSLHHNEVPFMIHPLVQAVILFLRTEDYTSGLWMTANKMNNLSASHPHLLVQRQHPFFTDVSFCQIDCCEQRKQRCEPSMLIFLQWWSQLSPTRLSVKAYDRRSCTFACLSFVRMSKIHTDVLYLQSCSP